MTPKPEDPNETRNAILGFIVLALVYGIWHYMIAPAFQSQSRSVATVSTAFPDKNQPTLGPLPTATTEQVPDRSEFYQEVDRRITGAMIAANKFKYVGDKVSLTCTVRNIPDRSFFNASCGEDSDGDPATIVIKYDDVSSLEPGQSVRILGTVEDPMEGTNIMGGSMSFPTVRSEFME